ncbi:MAG TPA: hypothetical protein VIQ30_19100 [Pseudonocardia sp.]
MPLTVAGRAASSTNPATWSSYRAAVESTAGVGLGFVLNGDHVVCIDLDHCLTGGVLAPWAANLLEQIPGTYIEVSPSGKGLHVWALGDVGRGRRCPVAGGGLVEIYGRGRYITVTGNRYRSCPPRLAELPEVVARIAVDGLT